MLERPPSNHGLSQSRFIITASGKETARVCVCFVSTSVTCTSSAATSRSYILQRCLNASLLAWPRSSCCSQLSTPLERWKLRSVWALRAFGISIRQDYQPASDVFIKHPLARLKIGSWQLECHSLHEIASDNHSRLPCLRIYHRRPLRHPLYIIQEITDYCPASRA